MVKQPKGARLARLARTSARPLAERMGDVTQASPSRAWLEMLEAAVIAPSPASPAWAVEPARLYYQRVDFVADANSAPIRASTTSRSVPRRNPSMAAV